MSDPKTPEILAETVVIKSVNGCTDQSQIILVPAAGQTFPVIVEIFAAFVRVNGIVKYTITPAVGNPKESGPYPVEVPESGSQEAAPHQVITPNNDDWPPETKDGPNIAGIIATLYVNGELKDTNGPWKIRKI